MYSAGQIGYAIVAMIARGLMLGPDQPVLLNMLDIPRNADTLNGVRMELVDAALPLLKGPHSAASVHRFASCQPVAPVREP
jgi:malate dehydrogenase